MGRMCVKVAGETSSGGWGGDFEFLFSCVVDRYLQLQFNGDEFVLFDCVVGAGEDCYASGGDAVTHSNQGAYNLTSSAQQYLTEGVVHQVAMLSNGLGRPDCRLGACLLFPWALIFGVQVRGVAASGKVFCFTALFAYFALAVIFLRAMTQDGALDGVLFFLQPQWQKILPNKVASFNRFDYNIGTLTLAWTSEKEISVVVNAVAAARGPQLASVTYPEANGGFDVAPQVWWRLEMKLNCLVDGQMFAVLFFLVLLTIGVGSASSLIGALVAAVTDTSPGGLVYISPAGFMIFDSVCIFVAHYAVVDLVRFHPALRLVGWAVVVCGLVPVMAVHAIYEQPGRNYSRRVKRSLRPKLSWGTERSAAARGLVPLP